MGVRVGPAKRNQPHRLIGQLIDPCMPEQELASHVLCGPVRILPYRIFWEATPCATRNFVTDSKVLFRRRASWSMTPIDALRLSSSRTPSGVGAHRGRPWREQGSRG